ncbi:MAG: FAD-dependent oxidoreductase [Candidatus Omnitrophota bacterium]|nr:FAD-dependent oxidoreductase [Candidatus Omnitrophota bacterium]
MSSIAFKEITVVGAGIAGLSFIRNIRAKNKDIKINLIEKNKHPFDRNKFITSLNTKEYIALQEFAQNEGVDFIQETAIKVNPERKKIYFKEKEPIDFQSLVIATGLKSKSISIKGEHREGFFYLSDIELFALKDLLRICDEVIGYVSTALGLKLALSLKAIGKEVRLLANTWDFLAEHKERMVNFLTEKNIPVHLGVSIEEVIGEGQVRATKINPLKVFSSQLVFIDSGFLQNLSFFEEGIHINNGIVTNYEDIYVIGDANIADIEKDYFYIFNQEEAKSQGLALAQYILEGKQLIFQRKTVGLEDKTKFIEEIFK